VQWHETGCRWGNNRAVTLTRRELKELLDANGLRPSRALGQNFVVDANTVRRIARLAALKEGENVIEIGAGLGSLSAELARSGARVTAMEVDKKLVPLLRAQLEGTDVRVVEADAMTVDWSALLSGLLTNEPGVPEASGSEWWTLVANLPYNVSVPVLMRVLDEAPAVQKILVMVQREVGERLAAEPHDAAYGAVSVKVAYHASARLVGTVPASVFVPRPAVESVLVEMTRREKVAVDPTLVSPGRLFDVVRAGFAKRRKMLRSALRGVVSPEAFDAAGIDPRSRAEELSVEEWGRLAV
jgi:16S rRNA (adenine1518-N6/adenine1519-N6)-dimethyltransferase